LRFSEVSWYGYTSKKQLRLPPRTLTISTHHHSLIQSHFLAFEIRSHHHHPSTSHQIQSFSILQFDSLLLNVKMMLPATTKTVIATEVKTIARRNIPALSAAVQTIARRHIQVAASAASSSSSTFSDTLSFASPESDLCHSRYHSTLKTTTAASSVGGSVWSESLSFTSPEADFTTRSTHSMTLQQTASGPVWSKSISFGSPEADFVSANLSTLSESKAGTTEEESAWSHSLSFSSPESDWCANTAPVHHHNRFGLPETFREVLQQETDQAIVVTTAQAPHMIVHVNAAWENLCGYTKAEAVHGSLALIQGPDLNRERTEPMAQMIQRVVETCQPQEIVLVNYSKSGRPFTNHLVVGPLHLKSKHSRERAQFLVGVLEEVPGEGNISQRRVTA
jgi:PAS domain-containing protein